MTKPNDYELIQKRWSESPTKAIENGARERVRKALTRMRHHALDVSRILVIGPQHGYELKEFHNAGVQQIFAIDPVREFVEQCRELGFPCHHQCAEELDPDMIGTGWGIYTCHALEHCYDLPAAVVGMKRVAHWCYITVPIEPEGTKDDAHFSTFENDAILPSLFVPWKVKWQKKVQSRETPNADMTYIFVPPEDFDE